MSDDLDEMREREHEQTAPEGDWLAKYYEPEEVLRENEEHRRERERRYEFLEREHLFELRGEGVDPELLAVLKPSLEQEQVRFIPGIRFRHVLRRPRQQILFNCSTFQDAAREHILFM